MKYKDVVGYATGDNTSCVIFDIGDDLFAMADSSKRRKRPEDSGVCIHYSWFNAYLGMVIREPAIKITKDIPLDMLVIALENLSNYNRFDIRSKDDLAELEKQGAELSQTDLYDYLDFARLKRRNSIETNKGLALKETRELEKAFTEESMKHEKPLAIKEIRDEVKAFHSNNVSDYEFYEWSKE